MRVILVTHGKVNPMGHNGISRVVYGLNKYGKLAGIDCVIWSVVDGIKEETDFVRDEFVKVKCFPRVRNFLSTNSDICKKIKAEKDSVDLIHFHMPWLLDKLAVAKVCKECGIPYIVTGHSAYSSAQKQSWKMRLGKKYEIPFLNNAAAVHAITREESSEFKKFGVKSNLFVIPNSVDDPCDKYVEKEYGRNEIIKILFMGELRPQKNIGALIEAVAFLQEHEKRRLLFLIAGPDVGGSLRTYEEQAEKLGVAKQFNFLGGVFGEDRKRLFESADLYITPSLSEVISLSAIEAMAYGLPCIFTRQSDVSYFYNYHFFEMCENYSGDIAYAITEMLRKELMWNEMGKNARKCYEQNFTWTSNIIKFKEQYAKYSK